MTPSLHLSQIVARALRHRYGLQISLAMAAIMLAYAFLPGQAQAKDQARERLSLNSGWRFTKDDPQDVAGKLTYAKIKDWINQTGNSFLKQPPQTAKPEGDLGADVSYTKPDFDDGAWRKLDLPHDWGIEGPFKQEYPGDTGKLPWWGVGWYRKHFNIAAEDKGQRIFLDVDGAMAYAAVWLNGRFVGGWPYGYSSFRLELTPYVKFGGENVLAIRLDNPPNSSRWYPGGGIYRNVWLEKTSPIHSSLWGTYITTPEVTKNAATVDVKTTIDNQSAANETVTVRTTILDPNGQNIPGGVVKPTLLSIPAGNSASCESTFAIQNPKLWDLKRPELYVAVISIEQNGKIVDSYIKIFGIRTIKFDVDKGFILNGEHVKLNGVCDHHDLGALGSAINSRALQRQIEILKEMGCNAIRTSHNPPAPELLELCDRMGMVVMDEAFDCWQRGKTKNDYHLLYPDWHEKDLRALVRRDRNHPCVVLWSIGNEIGEQDMRDKGKIAHELAAIVHEEDLTRPVTAACHIAQARSNGFQKEVDVFGYNYKPGEYGKFREANPAIPLFGSETASCISSRGEYFFPV
ncbi:MAG: glycoside hydrolase family 2 TIM barrel-domain containing protein, partial [Thermoguttaceae bacterium]